MKNIELNWKGFNVNLKAIETFAKTLDSQCVGASAGANFTLHFLSDPYEIPTHEVVTPTEVTVSVPVLDGEGNPVLDDDGIATMQDEVQIQDVVTIEPTGEQSVAQKIQAKWDAIDEESEEATSYKTAAQIKEEKEADVAAKKATARAKFITMGLTEAEADAILGA